MILWVSLGMFVDVAEKCIQISEVQPQTFHCICMLSLEPAEFWNQVLIHLASRAPYGPWRTASLPIFSCTYELSAPDFLAGARG